MPARGADVLPGLIVQGCEEIVFVAVESRAVPGHLLDRHESRIVARRVGVEHTKLQRQVEGEERVDELAPLVVVVDHGIDVVAERNAQLTPAEEVVDLGEGQARSLVRRCRRGSGSRTISKP